MRAGGEVSDGDWLGILPSWLGIMTSLLTITIGAFFRLFLGLKKTDARVDLLEERQNQQHIATNALIDDLRRDIADQQGARREIWSRLDVVCDQLSRMCADLSYLRGRSGHDQNQH